MVSLRLLYDEKPVNTKAFTSEPNFSKERENVGGSWSQSGACDREFESEYLWNGSPWNRSGMLSKLH